MQSCSLAFLIYCTPAIVKRNRHTFKRGNSVKKLLSRPKRGPLKGKNFLHLRANSFLLEDAFSKRGRVANRLYEGRSLCSVTRTLYHCLK